MFSSNWTNPFSYFYNSQTSQQVRRDIGDVADDWVLTETDLQDEVLINFKSKSLPTAYSKPLNEITYNPDKSMNSSSSHIMYEGLHQDGSTHFIKYNDNKAMIYCEAFLGHLYSLSLLYGVGRGYARHNDIGVPIAVSSKELSGFQTFKQAPLTKEQLDDPVFRRRFIQILATFFRMHEDDGHCGNITTNLKLFDADC